MERGHEQGDESAGERKKIRPWKYWKANKIMGGKWIFYNQVQS